MRFLCTLPLLAIAGCMPFKYADVPLEPVDAFGYGYNVGLVSMRGGEFDLLVINRGVRWFPDAMQMRQEFRAIAIKRAAAQCGEEADLIDSFDRWQEIGGVEFRFRCRNPAHQKSPG